MALKAISKFAITTWCLLCLENSISNAVLRIFSHKVTYELEYLEYLFQANIIIDNSTATD